MVQSAPREINTPFRPIPLDVKPNEFFNSPENLQDLTQNNGLLTNDDNKLIITISQNSIGNAITELLGVVVKRTPNALSHEKAEPALIKKLLKLRSRLIEADLGHGIKTKYWNED